MGFATEQRDLGDIDPLLKALERIDVQRPPQAPERVEPPTSPVAPVRPLAAPEQPAGAPAAPRFTTEDKGLAVLRDAVAKFDFEPPEPDFIIEPTTVTAAGEVRPITPEREITLPEIVQERQAEGKLRAREFARRAIEAVDLEAAARGPEAPAIRAAGPRVKAGRREVSLGAIASITKKAAELRDRQEREELRRGEPLTEQERELRETNLTFSRIKDRELFLAVAESLAEESVQFLAKGSPERAAFELEAREKALEQMEPIGIAEAAARFTRGAELLPFLGSIFKMDRFGQLKEASDILRLVHSGKARETVAAPLGGTRPRATVDEIQNAETLILDYLQEVEEVRIRGKTLPAKVFDTLVELPAFMTEFFATAGIASVGREGAKAAVTRLIGKGLNPKVASMLVKASGWVAGAAARIPAVSGRVGAFAAERQIPTFKFDPDTGTIVPDKAGEPPLKALMGGLADTLIELMSESAGQTLSSGAKKITSLIPGLRRIAPHVAEGLRRLGLHGGGVLTKAGFDGALEEMGEEQLGQFMRFLLSKATGLDLADTPFQTDPQELAVQFLAFSAVGGGQAIAQGAQETRLIRGAFTAASRAAERGALDIPTGEEGEAPEVKPETKLPTKPLTPEKPKAPPVTKPEPKAEAPIEAKTVQLRDEAGKPAGRLHTAEVKVTTEEGPTTVTVQALTEAELKESVAIVRAGQELEPPPAFFTAPSAEKATPTTTGIPKAQARKQVNAAVRKERAARTSLARLIKSGAKQEAITQKQQQSLLSKLAGATTRSELQAVGDSYLKALSEQAVQPEPQTVTLKLNKLIASRLRAEDRAGRREARSISESMGRVLKDIAAAKASGDIAANEAAKMFGKLRSVTGRKKAELEIAAAEFLQKLARERAHRDAVGELKGLLTTLKKSNRKFSDTLFRIYEDTFEGLAPTRISAARQKKLEALIAHVNRMPEAKDAAGNPTQVAVMLTPDHPEFNLLLKEAYDKAKAALEKTAIPALDTEALHSLTDLARSILKQNKLRLQKRGELKKRTIEESREPFAQETEASGKRDFDTSPPGFLRKLWKLAGPQESGTIFTLAHSMSPPEEFTGDRPVIIDMVINPINNAWLEKISRSSEFGQMFNDRVEKAGGSPMSAKVLAEGKVQTFHFRGVTFKDSGDPASWKITRQQLLGFVLTARDIYNYSSMLKNGFEWTQGKEKTKKTYNVTPDSIRAAEASLTENEKKWVDAALWLFAGPLRKFTNVKWEESEGYRLVRLREVGEEQPVGEEIWVTGPTVASRGAIQPNDRYRLIQNKTIFQQRKGGGRPLSIGGLAGIVNGVINDVSALEQLLPHKTAEAFLRDAENAKLITKKLGPEALDVFVMIMRSAEGTWGGAETAADVMSTALKNIYPATLILNPSSLAKQLLSWHLFATPEAKLSDQQAVKLHNVFREIVPLLKGLTGGKLSKRAATIIGHMQEHEYWRLRHGTSARKFLTPESEIGVIPEWTRELSTPFPGPGYTDRAVFIAGWAMIQRQWMKESGVASTEAFEAMPEERLREAVKTINLRTINLARVSGQPMFNVTDQSFLAASSRTSVGAKVLTAYKTPLNAQFNQLIRSFSRTRYLLHQASLEQDKKKAAAFSRRAAREIAGGLLRVSAAQLGALAISAAWYRALLGWDEDEERRWKKLSGWQRAADGILQFITSVSGLFYGSQILQPLILGVRKSVTGRQGHYFGADPLSRAAVDAGRSFTAINDLIEAAGDADVEAEDVARSLEVISRTIGVITAKPLTTVFRIIKIGVRQFTQTPKAKILHPVWFAKHELLSKQMASVEDLLAITAAGPERSKQRKAIKDRAKPLKEQIKAARTEAKAELKKRGIKGEAVNRNLDKAENSARQLFRDQLTADIKTLLKKKVRSGDPRWKPLRERFKFLDYATAKGPKLWQDHLTEIKARLKKKEEEGD